MGIIVNQISSNQVLDKNIEYLVPEKKLIETYLGVKNSDLTVLLLLYLPYEYLYIKKRGARENSSFKIPLFKEG